MSDLSTEVLDKLRSFDTPTICNLIELFDVRPRNAGFCDARISACYPDLAPMVGVAATATFRSAGPPQAGDVYGDIDSQAERFDELSGPPVIVFQDLDDPPAGATFGEVMCSTYRAFGAVGLITSGAGRDLDQVETLDFPVFTNGDICAHAYCHILDVHVPVHVGGLTIYPDDLLHGDRNGVTTIPSDIAGEVADIGDEYVAAEQLMLDALAAESPSLAEFREARDEAHARIANLRRRVSGSS